MATEAEINEFFVNPAGEDVTVPEQLGSNDLDVYTSDELGFSVDSSTKFKHDAIIDASTGEVIAPTTEVKRKLGSTTSTLFIPVYVEPAYADDKLAS